MEFHFPQKIYHIDRNYLELSMMQILTQHECCFHFCTFGPGQGSWSLIFCFLAESKMQSTRCGLFLAETQAILQGQKEGVVS